MGRGGPRLPLHVREDPQFRVPIGHLRREGDTPGGGPRHRQEPVPAVPAPGHEPGEGFVESCKPITGNITKIISTKGIKAVYDVLKGTLTSAVTSVSSSSCFAAAASVAAAYVLAMSL